MVCYHDQPRNGMLRNERNTKQTFCTMVQDDYGKKKKPTTTRTPQANSIIKRVHQLIGNLIQTHQVGSEDINKSDPWSDILAATMFATQATYHTITQAIPVQLVFGRDARYKVQRELKGHSFTIENTAVHVLTQTINGRTKHVSLTHTR